MTTAHRCHIFPRLHIGYDISGTNNHSHFSHTMLQTMLSFEVDYRYTLYSSFGESYFESHVAPVNPYVRGTLGPVQHNKAAAIEFWNQPQLEKALNHLHILHSNHFWCPSQPFNETRLIYTLSDLSFLTDSSLSSIDCFDGVFNASICADWIIATSDAIKLDFIDLFPHFPTERIHVISPSSESPVEQLLALYHTAWTTPKKGFI